MRIHYVVISIAGLLATAACSSSSDGSSDGGRDASGGSDGGDGGTNEMTYSLPTGSCFTFATASSQASSTACGDLMAVAGAKVDLFNGEGVSQLCQLSGTFASLDAVPTSYASCTWSSYIEGGAGLTNAGVIVLDSSGAHHYRMRIVSNTLPNLVYEFAMID